MFDSSPTLQRAAKLNAADPVTAQYYRRFDDNMPQYFPHSSHSSQYSSSVFGDGFKELSNEEMRHVYQNSSLTEEVRSRLKSVVSVELCSKVLLRCLCSNKTSLEAKLNLIPVHLLLASKATGSI